MSDIWIYGPQRSESNRSYAIGTKKWKEIYIRNAPSYSLYKLITPEYIYAHYFEHRFDDYIQNALKKSNTILDLLLIHSAFVNAYGILLTNVGFTDAMVEKLGSVYTVFYLDIKQLVENMELFTGPFEFRKLSNSNTDRPKNIKFTAYTDEEIISMYPLLKAKKKHPISKSLQNCGADITETRFENIKNPVFQPLANVIGCHFSLFKQKMEKTQDATTTTFIDDAQMNKINVADYSYFKKQNIIGSDKKPPILIRKKKGTYLSQLFEKTCVLLFKPYYVKPKSNSKEAIMSAMKENKKIINNRCRGYMNGNLSVFQTSIYNLDNIQLETDIPVFFIIDDKVEVDLYSGSSIEFYRAVIKELFEYKVFKKVSQRYELNTDFDIEVLECYKDLPTELKTAELKKEVTEYFFLIVGNIMHFAVSNNLELPFKLSRIYIMKLFKLFDFTEKDPVTNTLKIFSPENLEMQLLLISVYLLEKAPPDFSDAVLQILEDPKKLLSSEMIKLLDSGLKESQKNKGVRINGRGKINDDNFHIYSENEDTLFYNMVEYLYKTALKEYTHQNLEMFFKGFSTICAFDNKLEAKMVTTNFYNHTFKQRLGIVCKADIFLSGFDFNYETIKYHFLPQISVSKFPLPLLLFDKGTFDEEYLPETSLNGSESEALKKHLKNYEMIEGTGLLQRGISQQLQTVFFLYRILLNQGNDISKEFITFYNSRNPQRREKMTDEDYHNEFVKMLLKTWSGIDTITNINYKIYIELQENKPPTAQFGFISLKLNKTYKSASELYSDLVTLVTESSQAGGKKKRRK